MKIKLPHFLSLKGFLPRSLFARSLLILIVPVLLIQMITSFMFFDRHWSKVTTRLAYAVAGEVSVLGDMIEVRGAHDEGVTQLMDEMNKDLSLQAHFVAGGELGADQGRNLPAHVVESLVVSALKKELRATVRRPFLVNIDFREKHVEIAVQLLNGVLNLDLPGRRLFSSSGYVFLLWMFSSSFILLFVAVLFMRNQVRPIRRLAVAAERFGKGRDAPHFKPSGALEVRQAAQSFIDMRRRIQRQMEQRAIMLAGVSHDLRTPLTRLKLEVEMLEGRADVAAMRSDIQEMEHMISGYLNFVRDESEEDMTYSTLKNLLTRLTDLAQRQDITIKCEDVTPEASGVKVQPIAFERCMMNLITNAAYYAQNIWLTAQEEEQSILFCVEDDGPGIDPALYDDVFKPFFRGDSARGAHGGGNVGLGLSIAMDIVHNHGGDIQLGQSQYGGLKVSVTLPK